MLCICFYDQTILSTVFGNGGVLVCQARGSVNVGVPSLAMLNAQSDQLDAAREMPIYPSFLEVRIKCQKVLINLFISSWTMTSFFVLSGRFIFIL